MKQLLARPFLNLSPCRMAVAIGLLLAGLITARADAQSNKNPTIFRGVAEAVGVEIQSSGPNHKGVVRSRPVTIATQDLAPLRAADRFILNLFDDVALQAVVTSARQSTVETTHWTARIEGNPHSSIHLVLHRDALAGIIRVPSVGDFRIRSAPGIGPIIEELDPAAFPVCGTGAAQRVHHDPDADNMNDASLVGPQACPTFVDVMVVYTPEARDAEGGTNPIRALAMLAVDETNSIFINSEINTRLNLVHIAETNYVETGFFGTELDRLRGTADGFMDEVHALRDQYGADLVDLLISHTEGGTICGIAYLMTSVSTAFAADAFSVCNTGCTSGGYTFPHEVGHNMGCHHDRDNAGGPGAYSFSYGHRFTGDDDVVYRTTMAYDPGSRIPYFSNPNILHQGQPIGLPEGDANSADNARTINQTSSTVEQFRASVPFTFGPTDPPHTWENPVQILPDDLAAGDRFGTAVALHGDLMIVGSYLADGSALDIGAAYVFRWDSTLLVWVQEAKLVANDAQFNDRLGVAVDVYDDGKGGGFAAVGAFLDDDGGRDAGAVYVFRRSAMSWSQEQKLVPMESDAGDLFGRTLAVAATTEGEFILIGAYLQEDSGSLNKGAAYVYHNTGLPWMEMPKLQAADGLNQDQFGFSVALDASAIDGHLTAIIGAWRDDEAAMDSGSAYIFDRGIEGWSQTAKLTHSNAAINDQFGYSVDLDITDTGKVAIVSAWTVDGPDLNTGAAYIFREYMEPPPPPPPADGSLAGPTTITWLQESQLTSSDPFNNDRFGSSVAISGNAAIVGAYQSDETEDDVGAAHVFRHYGLGWTQESRIVHDLPAFDDEFGFYISLQGERAAISAWGRDVNKLELAGAVYVIDAQPIVDCNENGISDACDIAIGTSMDVDMNGIPDECENPPDPCPADLAPSGGDNQVGVPDLLAILNAWGPCAGCPEDIAPPGPPAGDGNVGVPDLLAILNAWGPCPP